MNGTSEKSEKVLLNFVEYNHNAVYLDCGCFDGQKALEIANKIGTRNIYGIELSNYGVMKSLEKGIKVQQTNLNNKFPYPDCFFDVVTAIHVSEHLINVNTFYSEIYRVLKPLGYCIIVTPNLASWHNIFALLIGIQPPSGPYIDEPNMQKINETMDISLKIKDFNPFKHLTPIASRSLIKLLKKHKFQIVKIEGGGLLPISRYYFKNIIQNRCIPHTLSDYQSKETS